MLKKNQVVTGMLIGIIFPAISWVIFWYILQNKLIYNNKPLIPYLVALGLNLFIARFFFKEKDTETGTGIMVISMAVMIIAFMFQSYLR